MQPEAGETVIVTSLRLLFEILGQLPEILCQMLVTRCYKYSIIMAERKKERKKKDKRVRSFPPSPPPSGTAGNVTALGDYPRFPRSSSSSSSSSSFVASRRFLLLLG